MTKKLVPLADVLWRAANECLSELDFLFNEAEKEVFSCCAAYVVEFPESRRRSSEPYNWEGIVKRSKTIQFLKELGCPTGSSLAFKRFEPGEKRQGVRYMWLMLAMHVAKDEGIMIEVER